MEKNHAVAGPSLSGDALATVLVGKVRELAQTRAEIANLKTERDAYRLLAQQALHQLHQAFTKIRRQKDTIAAVLQEGRVADRSRQNVGRAA